MTAKEKLIKTFFDILTIKNFQDINISELCRISNVHRTTFYAYYDNLMELLEDAKKYAINKFFSAHIQKRDEIDFLSMDILVPYLNFIKSYANLYKAYLTNSKIFEAEEDFEKLYHEIFLKDALNKHKHVDEWMVRKITNFFIDGINGLIKSWLEDGCKENAEEIAQVIVTIRNFSN